MSQTDVYLFFSVLSLSNVTKLYLSMCHIILSLSNVTKYCLSICHSVLSICTVIVYCLLLQLPRRLLRLRSGRPVRCETCNITLNSEHQARQHFAGKNHARRISKLVTQLEESKKADDNGNEQSEDSQKADDGHKPSDEQQVQDKSDEQKNDEEILLICSSSIIISSSSSNSSSSNNSSNNCSSSFELAAGNVQGSSCSLETGDISCPMMQTGEGENGSTLSTDNGAEVGRNDAHSSPCQKTLESAKQQSPVLSQGLSFYYHVCVCGLGKSYL